MTINGYEIKHTTGGTNYRIVKPDGSTVDFDALAAAGLLGYAMQSMQFPNKEDTQVVNHKLDAILTAIGSFGKSIEKIANSNEKLSSTLEKLAEKLKTGAKKSK